MKLGDELRVADVVREHAASAARPRRRAPPRARSSPTRSSTTARAGSRRLCSTPASSAGSRVAYLDRTAPEIVELLFAAREDRRGHGAAELAARGGRARRGGRRTPNLRVLIVGESYASLAADLGSTRTRSSSGRRLRGVDRRLRRRRPRRAGGIRRRGPPALHLGDDGRPEGRAHDAPQPRGRRRDVAALGVRRGVRQPHRAADVPHRRHRLDVPRTVERRDDRARERVRRRRRPRPDRAAARHQRRARPDDDPDAARCRGCRRSRLLGVAVDRVRRVADHDARAEERAAHVRLLLLRHLRADGVDRRRDAARSGRPRSRRAARASAPQRRTAVSVGRAAGRRSGHGRRARGRRDRRGLAARPRMSRPGTSTARTRPPPRSPTTAGSGPATAATSTPTATCSSPTGSRT